MLQWFCVTRTSLARADPSVRYAFSRDRATKADKQHWAECSNATDVQMQEESLGGELQGDHVVCHGNCRNLIGGAAL